MKSKKKKSWRIPDRYWRIISNRYFIVSFGALIWIAFFDRYNFIDRYRTAQKIKEYEKERDYYVDEVNKNKAVLHSLFTNDEVLEKFAREQFHFKRDSEDVFMIVRQ